MTDTIAGGTDGPSRPPRRTPGWRRGALLDRLRGRRWPVALGAVAVAAVVVAVSRAGLPAEPVAAPTPTPTGPVTTGYVLDLATGTDRVYALVDACWGEPRECGVELVASTDDGRSWERRALPPELTERVNTDGVTLRIAGPDDTVTLSDVRRGRLHLSTDGGRTFTGRSVTRGAALDRIPAGREAYARLCPEGCAVGVVEFLDPRTALRRPLAVQPPFGVTAFAVEGGQLWAAGIDPRTGRYAAAVSTDDGAEWQPVPLPALRFENRMVARIAPVPEQDLAYVMVGHPQEGGGQTVYDLWTAPDPRGGGTGPRRITTEGTYAQVAYGVVGLADGRLMLDAYHLIEPDGTVDAAEGGPGRFGVRDVRRGPGTLLTGQVLGRDAGLRIAVADAADPFDWKIRFIELS